MRFNFDKTAAIEYVRDASHRALDSGAEIGHAFWDQVVPVSTDPRSTGGLKDSWFSEVRDEPARVVLIIGAMAKYAIYIELGTSKLPPRAPLRTVAGEVAAILPSLLQQELTD